MNTKVRVAVNGYGVIGKRVADAILVQGDMTLTGVADVSTDWRTRLLKAKGMPLFAGTAAALQALRAAGITVTGGLEDLLSNADVVVDCTLKRVAAENVPIYRERGLKFILQGGEKHAITSHSFVAEANFETAVGLGAFRTSSRILLMRDAYGLEALNSVKEMMADIGRSRIDLYEVALWAEMLKVQGDELFYAYMVDNHAIVIPETIDAIRALSGWEPSGRRSIAATDAAMGIGGDVFDLPKPAPPQGTQ